jgi:hypothetical protein
MTALDRLGELDVPLCGVVLLDETVNIDFNLSRLGGDGAVDRDSDPGRRGDAGH